MSAIWQAVRSFLTDNSKELLLMAAAGIIGFLVSVFLKLPSVLWRQLTKLWIKEKELEVILRTNRHIPFYDGGKPDVLSHFSVTLKNRTAEPEYVEACLASVNRKTNTKIDCVSSIESIPPNCCPAEIHFNFYWVWQIAREHGNLRLPLKLRIVVRATNGKVYQGKVLTISREQYEAYSSEHLELERVEQANRALKRT